MLIRSLTHTCIQVHVHVAAACQYSSILQLNQQLTSCDVFSGEEEEEEEEDEKSALPKKIMPDLVVHLDAEDAFLRNRFTRRNKLFGLTLTVESFLCRIMNLPENVVAGTHNTEEGLNRRLVIYREQNNEEDTILNYFDELEIHPHKYGQSQLRFVEIPNKK